MQYGGGEEVALDQRPPHEPARRSPGKIGPQSRPAPAHRPAMGGRSRREGERVMTAGERRRHGAHLEDVSGLAEAAQQLPQRAEGPRPHCCALGVARPVRRGCQEGRSAGPLRGDLAHERVRRVGAEDRLCERLRVRERRCGGEEGERVGERAVACAELLEQRDARCQRPLCRVVAGAAARAQDARDTRGRRQRCAAYCDGLGPWRRRHGLMLLLGGPWLGWWVWLLLRRWRRLLGRLRERWRRRKQRRWCMGD